MKKIDKIMYRILSKNIIECIEADLQWYGINYIKEVYRQVCIVNTSNKDIKIRLDRTDNLFHNNDPKVPRYICSITFINNLNIELFSIQFSEFTAVAILDAMYEYENFPMFDMNLNLPNGVSIKLKRIDEFTKFDIYKVNEVFHTIDLKLSFTMESDYIVDDLLYSMYFSWLIDIDNGEYMFEFINDYYL